MLIYFENSKSNTDLTFSMLGEYFQDTKTPLEAVKNYLQKDKIKHTIIQAYNEKCESENNFISYIDTKRVFNKSL